jgi:MarR family transcriptional regulator, organic hydroperoxide resistance regulator
MKHRHGGFLIAKIHRTAGRIFARMLRERGIGINPAQGRILFVLWEEGPTTIHELAKRSGLAKSTLTSSLDRLEAQGQVLRVRDAADRRRITIELTPGNQAMQRLYDRVSKEMVAVFYRGFARSEIAAFEKNLERVMSNLGRSEEPASRRLV